MKDIHFDSHFVIIIKKKLNEFTIRETWHRNVSSITLVFYPFPIDFGERAWKVFETKQRALLAAKRKLAGARGFDRTSTSFS